METSVLSSMAARQGISSPRLIGKASELERLVSVRGAGLALTGSARAALCLDLAAQALRIPLTTTSAARLSGLSPKVYASSRRSFETVLGQSSFPTLQELATRFGRVDVTRGAAALLLRYETSLTVVQAACVDLSQPLFLVAALATACRQQKVKVSRTQLLAVAGVRPAIFDRLCSQMDRVSPATIESPVDEMRQKLNKDTPGIDQVGESEGIASESEDVRKRSTGNKRGASLEQDYESWKRQILENAAKINEGGS
uniref:origin recognition complex subunit 6 isoform X2 n=1 Tax=Myxine glutinosa TaxID=7769 RepID=UPI00358DE390